MKEVLELTRKIIPSNVSAHNNIVTCVKFKANTEASKSGARTQSGHTSYGITAA